MQTAKDTYFVIVIVHNETDKVMCTAWRATYVQIVASGSVMLERKFLRSAGTIGHIEDIAVSKTMQGRKLGLRLINALDAVGSAMGCYKIILDCSKENIRKHQNGESELNTAFYEKCGYRHKEYQMVRYFKNGAPTMSKL